MPQATLDARRRVSPKLAFRVSEKRGYVIASRHIAPNNIFDNPSPRPDVRRRAFISTIGPKSAMSRQTHLKNSQCGN
jgi:hypothetical protein